MHFIPWWVFWFVFCDGVFLCLKFLSMPLPFYPIQNLYISFLSQITISFYASFFLNPIPYLPLPKFIIISLELLEIIWLDLWTGYFQYWRIAYLLVFLKTMDILLQCGCIIYFWILNTSQRHSVIHLSPVIHLIIFADFH